MTHERAIARRAASRSASVSAGRAGTFTTSSPLSASRSTWRRIVWNSPSVVTISRTFQEWQGRQPARDELVRVLAEGDVLRRVAEQSGEAGPTCRRLSGRPRPLVVDELGGIEPRALLGLEADVGPRLVGMSGQQQAFGDVEARVVWGEGVRYHACARLQLRADLPQIRKQIAPQASSRRYAAPATRPCPACSPMVRSTIRTW